jgi:DNA-binding transcriptional LysR family regulator
VAESRDLRYFVAVAERLSFSRAAEDLPLSQSALSEAVRRLEGEVGTRLLRRSSRRVELTPAGEHLRATLVSSRRALVREALADRLDPLSSDLRDGLEEIVDALRRYE